MRTSSPADLPSSRTKRSLSLAVAVSVLIAGGCSTEKKEPSITWEHDRSLVLSELQQVREGNTRLRGQLERMSVRLAELQSSMKKQHDEFQLIREQNAGEQQLLTALASQHNKLLAKTQQPARVPSVKHNNKQKQSPAARPEKKRLIPSMENTVSRPDISPESARTLEKNLYSTAYLAYKSARYDEAIRAFRQQLKAFPSGEYSNSAIYWLGESLLAQKHYPQALNMFRKYIENTTEGGKLAAALLAKARAEMAQQNPQAQQTLRDLINRFPASSAAEQARALLRK